MKQLQNGIYTFNIGEKDWGKEANQNFETLDSLIKNVTDNNARFESLSEKIQTNTVNLKQAKEDLTDNIANAKNELQDQINIINNNTLALKYKVDNINTDSTGHAEEADVAITAYKADVAKKLENSLTVGNTSFDGSANVTVIVDGAPIQNSPNLINSNAVYSALELKQNKATTLSGYNITDAYTKSEINNLISQEDNTSKSYVDTKISELVNSAPETLDTLKELSDALGNDPNFATTVSAQIGLKANDTDVIHKTGNETASGVKTFSDGIISKITYNTKETSLGVDYYYGVNFNDSKIRFYGKGETNGNCACVSSFNKDSTNSSTLEVHSSGNDNSIMWNGLVKNNVIPFQNDYYDLGSTSNKWKNLYVTSINGKTPAGISDIPTNVSQLINDSKYLVGADILGKADKATTLAGYGITNAYTKSETDTLLGNKSNNGHTHDDRYYTESEVNSLLGGKSDTNHNHDSVYLGISAKAASASSADSVAWSNVSGKPSTYTPSSHTHDDRYYTESEVNNLLGGKSDTSHNHNGTYVPVSASCNKNWNWSGQSGQPTWLWGSNDGTNMYVYNPSNFSVNYANSAGSVAWANVSGKPSSYTPSSHTHDDRYYTESEVNSLLGGKSDTSHTHSNYLTGITKAMVTNALGYTPPTSDTNTTYSAGTNLSLSGTTFNVSSTPSFTSITLNGYTVTVD